MKFLSYAILVLFLGFSIAESSVEKGVTSQADADSSDKQDENDNVIYPE